ncbi:MATE family efflux transporter [Marinobacterium mangrovicola]|uniref:Putative MATE family efflux protein n=1 Tax=Marinobacterium mangrovicola TaxID=1476959 RepID=A0A4R1H7S3_9GAMM|nr:MATE family efflux transporter [Marinobacterium mangrovicola]TCK16433.1 putative MATE family efflux protein [Marinobacterium mangrovicola]
MSPAPDILKSPVQSTLVRMTLPMMLGIVSLMLFNIADIWFVGQLGTEPMAALAFTFPVTFSVTSLAIGLGVGTSATLARLIGAGENRNASRMATDNIIMTVLIMLVVGIGGHWIIDPVFRAMGAESGLMPYIHAYMTVWFSGSVFLVLNMVCNSIFRAAGDTRMSGLVMLVSAILNLLLDPLFIFGFGPIPALGIQGAAVASVLAWGSTTLLAFYLLYGRRRMLIFAWPDLAEMFGHWKQLMQISLPAAFSNMMTPLANGVLTAVVAGHGAEAVAAYGVGNRVESLSLLVCLALSMTLPPFISQNYGAGQVERVRKAYMGAVRFALIWQGLIYLALFIFANPLAILFTEDPEVSRWLALWMVVVPAGFGFQAITFLSASSFNALHQPMRAMRISLFRLFIMYVPLGWLGSLLFGLEGMFAALVLANGITATLAYTWMRRYLARLAR